MNHHDEKMHERHHDQDMHGEQHGHDMHGKHHGDEMHEMHGKHHQGGRRSGCLTKQYIDMVTGKTVVARVYGMFQQLYEPQGYFLNKDRDQCFEIIGGGMANKKLYGYMACPCRPVSGVREKDKDMICPCDYRDVDVKEYGSCYCNLFVSKEWNEGKIPHVEIPDRRPAEKYSD
jgi:ferredoxin-thioredoxin reductase catalytic subunit